jgi:hypothetical protein
MKLGLKTAAENIEKTKFKERIYFFTNCDFIKFKEAIEASYTEL